MLRRVLAATLSSVVLAVLVLGVPLAVAGIGLTRGDAQRSVQARADALALAADLELETGEELTTALLEPYVDAGDEWTAAVEVLRPGVRSVRIGDPARWAVVGSATTASGLTARVTVAQSSLLAADVRLVVLVGAVSAGAVAAAWALAQVQARRLVRPLTDLAGTARALGEGRVPPALEPTGVAEVDEVAGALAASAARIAAVLAAERDFSADASHQLRTPLTALSMRLDEIAATTTQPEVEQEAQAALAQVERLTAVVTDLLHRSRAAALPDAPGGPDGRGGADGRGRGPGHALAGVLAQQAVEWEPVYRAAGRALDVVLPDPGVRSSAAPGPVAQAVATLVENALVHGGGTTRVRVVTAGPEGPFPEGPFVVVEVSDEGPGVPEELGARVFERRVSGAAGTGLGLGLARDLVTAEGGSLELARRRPAAFRLYLPRA